MGILSINSVDSSKAVKELMWFVISIPVIITCLSLDRMFYEKWSGVIYIISVLLLAGLFTPLGKEINGNRAWYVFGPISLQPTEFAKLGTALMVGNYLTTPKLDTGSYKTLFTCFLIIAVPLLLIKAQPDDGSVLVFSSFFVGLLAHQVYFIKQLFIIGLVFLTLFIMGISMSGPITYLNDNLDVLGIIIGVLCLVAFLVLKNIYYERSPLVYGLVIGGIIICFATVFASDRIFSKLKPHQKDRIEILFLDDTDKKVRFEKHGYNLFTAKSCIASGELWGKGYKKGDITDGKIVPEQETDYIFTTIGEQFGFIGSSIFILAYGSFLIRLFWIAGRQRSIFASYFSFSIASVFTLHFIINIGMVLGIIPTIGIPLPLMSYGGSSFLAFTMMLFIMVRLDAERKNTLG